MCLRLAHPPALPSSEASNPRSSRREEAHSPCVIATSIVFQAIDIKPPETKAEATASPPNHLAGRRCRAALISRRARPRAPASEYLRAAKAHRSAGFIPQDHRANDTHRTTHPRSHPPQPSPDRGSVTRSVWNNAAARELFCYGIRCSASEGRRQRAHTPPSCGLKSALRPKRRTQNLLPLTSMNTPIFRTRLVAFIALLFALGISLATAAETTAHRGLPAGPLSLSDCLDLALKQNSAILKGQSDLEAAYGVVIQTRAIAIPKIRSTGNYQIQDKQAVDRIPAPFITADGDQSWSANVRLVQSIYEGGRIRSALRTARLTKEQAVANFQTVVANTLLDVRIACYDILLAAQQITVQEASVHLLEQELEDNKRRFEAGSVPQFNVLRAEVEVANARPRLIRARNAWRIAKNNLANLLGLDLPKEVWDNPPLELSGKLEAAPYDIALPVALSQALERRPELAVLRKSVALREEAIKTARAARLPSVQLYAGYGSRSSVFSDDLGRDISGWQAGGQLSWDIFDGHLTKGKVQEARALREKAGEEFDDTARKIELEVRTAYSNFNEAKEVLESQKKVQELAVEALRLASARSEAGTGTQLDVLNSQTALTEARVTEAQALRDYATSQARLERAIGQNILQADKIPAR